VEAQNDFWLIDLSTSNSRETRSNCFLSSGTNFNWLVRRFSFTGALFIWNAQTSWTVKAPLGKAVTGKSIFATVRFWVRRLPHPFEQIYDRGVTAMLKTGIQHAMEATYKRFTSLKHVFKVTIVKTEVNMNIHTLINSTAWHRNFTQLCSNDFINWISFG